MDNLNDSKLVFLLKTLSEKELNQFLEFVHSPYFNKNKHISAFTKAFTEFHPTYEAVWFTKKELYKQIFSESPYKEQRINDLMSYTLKLLEDFLSLQQFENEKWLNEKLLLSSLRKKNVSHYFDLRSNEITKKIKEKNIYDEHRYFTEYEIAKEKDLLFLSTEGRSANDSLQHKTNKLDAFYIISKLKAFCEMANRSNILKTSYYYFLKNELLNIIVSNENKLEKYPAIKIYYTIYKTLTDSEQEHHFNDLLIQLNKHVHLFTSEEGRMMYDYAQNYCIKKLNQGNVSYNRHLFDLYCLLLNNGLIFDNGRLSEWDYKNIVSVATRLREFDWTKNFIENNTSKLPAAIRENAYVYNMASYHYSKGQYREALRLLSKVEFTDVFYHLGAKSLLLKMYYETEDSDGFFSLVDAFKVYLHRNKKLSAYQRETHENLVKYSARLFNIRLKYTGTQSLHVQLKKLNQRIIENSKISNIGWLKEQVQKVK